MNRVIDHSNLIVFFSLPFKPIGTTNPFFNGHIALAIDSTVYHIVNPYLLKTKFLFSIMPLQSWLFGKGGKWVERDPSSPEYTHVYLYRKSESTRTVVYGAGITVPSSIKETIVEKINDENRRFSEGDRTYNLFHANCSSIIADALVPVGLMDQSVLNKLPVMFFKRFVKRNKNGILFGSTSGFDSTRFTVHRFCYGLWSFNPKREMDRWITVMGARR